MVYVFIVNEKMLGSARIVIKNRLKNKCKKFYLGGKLKMFIIAGEVGEKAANIAGKGAGLKNEHKNNRLH